MSITPDQIAGVLTAGGYTPESFAQTMGRLAALDAYNKLTARRALMIADHAQVRAEQEAELGELDSLISTARRQADEVVGG